MFYNVMVSENVMCRKTKFKKSTANYKPKFLRAANWWKDVTCLRCLQDRKQLPARRRAFLKANPKVRKAEALISKTKKHHQKKRRTSRR